MRLRTITENKETFLKYNEFRKRIFQELSPKDADIILYLLPWLLSVNHPACPGYVRGLKTPFTVANIHQEAAILKKEKAHKRLFSVPEEENFLKFAPQANVILGIYTIGSAGSVSQTEHSDCDIWLCIDKQSYDTHALQQLHQKINLLKDWLDRQLKLPVYFFVSDIDDIRNCRFGQIDEESSGTMQKNLLKEELYRTMIVIAGKIPLWWICYEGGTSADYLAAAKALEHENIEANQFVDLGDIECISKDEYFGAALWQLNKSLTFPLKSIMKMLLMKMQIDSLPGELLCTRFRNAILEKGASPALSDPSLYTMKALLDYYQSAAPEKFEFIKHCLYLRFGFKMLSKRLGLKEQLAADLMAQYKIERNTLYRLNEFASWSFSQQVAFGEQIFQFLLDIYKEINSSPRQSSLSADDMTIIGHKIASCLVNKTDKILVIHKPISHINLPALTFKTNGKIWQVCESANPAVIITSHRDIVTCIAYLVWNGIYEAGQARMEYNPTAVTVQEIINLSKVIQEIFGNHDVSSIDFAHFLEPEYIVKMLVVVSFEGSPDEKNMNDLDALYLNHWGELFVRHFRAQEKLQSFVHATVAKQKAPIEIKYYVQRNSHYYEKNIERTKQAVLHALRTGMIEGI
ncbi:MAG: class I adenylate cyclase [Syntrophales bacterium]